MSFDPRHWRRLTKQSLLRDWDTSIRLLLSYRNDPNRTLSSWLGADLTPMQRKVGYALDHLAHKDHLHRVGAVHLLYDYWPKTDLTASAVADLLLFERNAVVRGVVYNSLRFFYGWLPDPEGVLEDLLSTRPEVRRHSIPSRKVRAAYDKKTRAEWVEKIGSMAQEMLGDLSLVELSLQSSDPQVREVALKVAVSQVKPDYAIAYLASQMVQSRLELDDLKRLAIAVVGRYRRITHDPTFNHLIVSVVKDQSCPQEIRLAAYRGLFDVGFDKRPHGDGRRSFNGTLITDVIQRSISNEFSFPDDVDWAFVDSFTT